MALLNTQTGEYIKIDKEMINIYRSINDIRKNFVIILEYKNQEHRSDGDSKRLRHIEYDLEIYNLSDIINNLDLRNNTIDNYKDLLATTAYIEMKKLDQYKDMIDC